MSAPAAAPTRSKPRPAAGSTRRQAASAGSSGPRPVAAQRAPHEETPDDGRTHSATLGESLQTLLTTAVDRLAGAAADRVEDLAGSLKDLAGDPTKLLSGAIGGGGVLASAVTAGGLAKLQGKNPVTAALKAGVGAMSTKTKVIISLLLILTAVLAPVVLLVVALGLLIATIGGAFSS